MRKLKYKNIKNSALENVIDLFLSLDSINLIQNFIQNIEVIKINDTQDELFPDTLHLHDNNLYALSKSDYISSPEFHLIIINRFCDSLKLYMKKYPVVDPDITSLILSDYSQTLFGELKSVDLSKIFNI